MIVPPQTLAPPAPFPLVLAQSVQSETIAPGVRRATYRLMTSDGPLVAHVVAIDAAEPTVRFGVVTASDRLISQGETLSSMASRTGAIAGVNADYFDIGNTYQPLNIVVGAGRLIRTPSKRAAIEFLHDRTIRVGSVGFSGSVAYAAARVALTKVNEWPPEGGAAFVTPRYGVLRAAPDVTLARLERVGAGYVDAANAAATLGGARFAANDGFASGTYRVLSVDAALAPVALDGPALGFGPAALRAAPAPQAGDLVQIAGDTDPSLEGVESAVGGGPLLVANGSVAVDPNAPAPEETDVRFPVSGAALGRDGGLAFVAVDGRQPSLSIGLTRPEFAALMLGLGASDALAFDSGGSAEVVARRLGDAEPSVRNAPSDGEERRIADGLFVYSDAPRGLHPQLVVRPSGFAAFGGSRVALDGAIVDDGGHRLRAADVPPLVASSQPGEHLAIVRETSGAMRATLAYRTVARAASLALDPERPNPAPGSRVHLRVRAFDESGAPIVLGPSDVRWRARGVPLASHASELDLPAGTSDFTIDAAVGRGLATHVATRVLVGSRRVDLALFAGANRASWRWSTAPPGGSGGIAYPDDDALQLSYDFRFGERASYANGNFLLPGEPLGFGLDVDGDTSGIGLRAAFVNRFGERRALTLARAIDWSGWRRVTLALPPDLNPPVTLVAIYAVPSLGNGVAHTVGTLRFRAAFADVAGNSR